MKHDPKAYTVSGGVEAIAAERQRQMDVEGWTPDHDDEHGDGQMAMAASGYAFISGCGENVRQSFPIGDPVPVWPWESIWWKPKDRRSDLVRAGALIAAEIDRLDRAEKSSTKRNDQMTDGIATALTNDDPNRRHPRMRTAADDRARENRKAAYAAIDSERDYQDELGRNAVNRESDPTFSPMTNLAIIEELCARMKSEFYEKPGHPSMDYMRKIAATAVRTMEAFGAPKRP